MGSSFEYLVATSPTVKTDLKSDIRVELQNFLNFLVLHLIRMMSSILFVCCLDTNPLHAYGQEVTPRGGMQMLFYPNVLWLTLTIERSKRSRVLFFNGDRPRMAKNFIDFEQQYMKRTIEKLGSP